MKELNQQKAPNPWNIDGQRVWMHRSQNETHKQVSSWETLNHSADFNNSELPAHPFWIWKMTQQLWEAMKNTLVSS